MNCSFSTHNNIILRDTCKQVCHNHSKTLERADDICAGILNQIQY